VISQSPLRNFSDDWATLTRPGCRARPGYILDLAGTEVLERERQLAADLLLYASRETDAARLGHSLEAHGDDDPVAIEVTAFDISRLLEPAEKDARRAEDEIAEREIRRQVLSRENTGNFRDSGRYPS